MSDLVPHPFRALVEQGQHAPFDEVLSPDVRFSSPVAFAPYDGREMVAAILRGAVRAFEDFRYVRQIGNAGDRDVALIFQARIGTTEVHGCDFLHHDDEGLISEFTVMVRPLSAARAVAEAMATQFEVVKAELEASA